jgi:hypothetical protein
MKHESELKHASRERNSTATTHTGHVQELHRTCPGNTTSELLLNWVQSANTGHVRYEEQHRVTLGEKIKKPYQMVSKNCEILTRASRHPREGLHQISAPNSKV